MDRLKVGIIFGGCSEEHPVSVKSAREVARNLDTEKYEPFWIGITKSGAWKLCDGPDANWDNGSCRPAVLSPDRSAHGLLVLEQGQYETISRKAAPKTQHQSYPPTFRQSRARSCGRQQRPYIAPWDAEDYRGWTCSSRKMER